MLTEFTDVEWEFNGVRDYLREEKAFADQFAGVNGPTMIRVEPDARNVHAGDDFTADLAVVNDRTRPLEATIQWEAFGEFGRESVTVDSIDTERLATAIDVTAPGVDDIDGVTTETVTASVAETDARWQTEVSVVPRADGGSNGCVSVFAPVSSVRATLTAAGYDPVSTAAHAETMVAIDSNSIE